jgi:hypothetical protein
MTSATGRKTLPRVGNAGPRASFGAYPTQSYRNNNLAGCDRLNRLRSRRLAAAPQHVNRPAASLGFRLMEIIPNRLKSLLNFYTALRHRRLRVARVLGSVTLSRTVVRGPSR